MNGCSGPMEKHASGRELWLQLTCQNWEGTACPDKCHVKLYVLSCKLKQTTTWHAGVSGTLEVRLLNLLIPGCVWHCSKFQLGGISVMPFVSKVNTSIWARTNTSTWARINTSTWARIHAGGYLGHGHQTT